MGGGEGGGAGLIEDGDPRQLGNALNSLQTGAPVQRQRWLGNDQLIALNPISKKDDRVRSVVEPRDPHEAIDMSPASMDRLGPEDGSSVMAGSGVDQPRPIDAQPVKTKAGKLGQHEISFRDESRYHHRQQGGPPDQGLGTTLPNIVKNCLG